MSINNPGLIKTFVAEAAVTKHRIVKHGAADGKVVHGAAATDALMGIVGALGQDTAGERADIVLDGTVEVEYGGVVAAGDPLTSDANGKAVKAAPALGANNRIIGFAMVAGVASDIGSVQIAPGQIQG